MKNEITVHNFEGDAKSESRAKEIIRKLKRKDDGLCMLECIESELEHFDEMKWYTGLPFEEKFESFKCDAKRISPLKIIVASSTLNIDWLTVSFWVEGRRHDDERYFAANVLVIVNMTEDWYRFGEDGNNHIATAYDIYYRQERN